MTETERVTDKTLRAWLNAGAVHRDIGGGLSFVATTAGAQKGQASWILRYRFGGVAREKVLGRYPDLSLKDAREAARQNRARIQQGVDVAAEKRAERLKAHEQVTVAPSRKPGTTATSPRPTSTPRSCCASSAATSSR